MESCLTCKLVARRDAGDAPLWDAIYRTEHWDVVHSYNTSLAGWLVLVTRRHMTAVDEMNEAEAVELGRLLRHVSLALRECVGCVKSYVVQFAEAAEHPHVHFHVIPRMADQPAELRGPAIFNALGVPEAARVDEAEMNRIGGEIRHSLNRMF